MIEVVRTIRCDAGCGAGFRLAGRRISVVKLRWMANWAGWHSAARTRDICPWCWEKGKR